MAQFRVISETIFSENKETGLRKPDTTESFIVTAANTKACEAKVQAYLFEKHGEDVNYIYVYGIEDITNIVHIK